LLNFGKKFYTVFISISFYLLCVECIIEKYNKTIKHKVERKIIGNTTVENDTTINVSELITVYKCHAINECFLV